MQHAIRQTLSEAEYLKFEATAPLRHEYVVGEVYAMVGGSQRHNRIALNIAAGLLARLEGKPCQVFMSDVKLHIAHSSAYYYPDVMVTCGTHAAVAGEAQAVNDPVLVVEVLSPGTETIDRREKLAAYRRLPSLQEYMLVSQETQQVELYRRQSDTLWLYMSYAPGDTLELVSLGGLQLALSAGYTGTDLA